MKKAEKTKAIILLLVLIAIGGIVMYGEKTPPIKSRAPQTGNAITR